VVSSLRSLGESLEAVDRLDRIVDPLHRVVVKVLRRGSVKDALHGVWLGHPLHPLLTDLPIGFWTSASVLDLLGGRRGRQAADAMVGLGVASALPTAVAGLADWSELNRPERRSGVVHAGMNLTATVLYATSFLERRAGRRRTGVALALAGATAATVGGFLGGHLTFSRGAGVNHAKEAPSDTRWNELALEGTPTRDRASRAHLDDAVLAVVDTNAGPAAIFARCSHLGGPLDEGEVLDGCIRCPWHQSTFRIADGAVVHGPATAPQPAYEVKAHDGTLRARRRSL